MWKRDEAVKPPAPPSPASPAATVPPSAPTVAASSPDVRPSGSRDVVHIGKSVVIKGELNGSEDLTIEGHVEGKIELRDHVFEPFVSSKKGGQGLGLALVHRLVRDMEGRVAHERDGKAGLTHFRVHLPVSR